MGAKLKWSTRKGEGREGRESTLGTVTTAERDGYAAEWK